MSTPTYNDFVFVNCPFDGDYKPILRAIVYALLDIIQELIPRQKT